MVYVAVKVNGKETLQGMLDWGSMTCTISNTCVERLQAAGVLPDKHQSEENIVLIGCGGQLTQPKGIYDLELELYGTRCVVPTLVIAGQPLDLIVGSNVIKYLLCSMKSSSEYWDLTSRQNRQCNTEVDQFLDMMSNIHHWRGDVEQPRFCNAMQMREISRSCSCVSRQYSGCGAHHIQSHAA